MTKLTLSRLREVMSYDRATGLFTRRVRLGARAPIGAVAGSVSRSDGRRRIRIDLEQFFSARLAWFYVFGEWPSGEIDHINMNRSDDRIENLRIATHQENNANRRVLPTNKSGSKGVSLLSRQLRKPYRAKITVNGRLIHLGYFSSKEAANEAYLVAASKYFGNFARAV